MKTPVLESLFNKLAGLQACNFIKKRHQQRYFPVNFAKILRTPFSQITSGRQLANYNNSKNKRTLQNKLTRLLKQNMNSFNKKWVICSSDELLKNYELPTFSSVYEGNFDHRNAYYVGYSLNIGKMYFVFCYCLESNNKDCSLLHETCQENKGKAWCF